jgi:DNA-binding HxlR family transcriptional regulator
MKLEKITKLPARRYEDACGTAHALDLIGERWALLVMRELMLGPKRFGDLRAGLPGVSANVLTQRLEGLEAAGLLMRRRLPPPASVQVYDLTDWGREAEPIVGALGKWAARSPAHDPTLPLSAVSMMLSLKTMFDAVKAGDVCLSIGFRFGPEGFVVTVADGVLTAERGAAEVAQVMLTARPSDVAAMVYGFRALDDLRASGEVAVHGDAGVFERFIGFFELPPKASV